MNGKEESSKEMKFVSYLERFKDTESLGPLADLRKGLGMQPGTAHEMHKYIMPWLGKCSKWEEETYYMVGSLYAWHQQSWHAGEGYKNTSFGASLATLKESYNEDAIERRFVALLKSHQEDLFVHLRQLVGLLRGKNVPVDWVRLLKDLKYWNSEEQWVQKRWSRAFWARKKEEE